MKCLLVVIALLIIFTSAFQFQSKDKPYRLMLRSTKNSSKKLTIDMMANKDGKSKKKKKDSVNNSESSSNIISTTSTSATSTTPSPVAQRVSNRINIPVRQQIAWAKAYKRLMTSQASAGSSTPKKFRQLNEPRVQEEYYEVDYVNTRPPAVFVDGYNIIGYINTVEGRNIDLEDARDCLIRY